MNLFRSLPLALSAIALFPSAAHAITPAKGDILIGFRPTATAANPGNSVSYVIDIGPASALRDATGPITIGNIDTDLGTTYGPDWATRTDILWSAIAAPDIATTIAGDKPSTIYLSKAQATEGVAGIPFSIPSYASRSNITQNFANAFGIGGVGGFVNYPASPSMLAPSNPDARYEQNGTPNAWRGFVSSSGGGVNSGIRGEAGGSGTVDFGAGEMEGNPTQTLSLFRYATTDENTQTVAPGVLLGSLKVQGDGTIVYTPAPATVTYDAWASTNVGGQAANLDYDHDGIPNGVEFFTGSNPAAFTAPTGITAGFIAWPRATGRTVSSVFVQTSTDLQTWSNYGSDVANGTGPVTYTFPVGLPKIFVRLKVTP